MNDHATLPPPGDVDAEARARNGGTSTPAGSSVWDIVPAPAAPATGPAEPAVAETPDQRPIADAPVPGRSGAVRHPGEQDPTVGTTAAAAVGTFGPPVAGTADPPAADPTPKPSAPRRGHRRIGRTRPGHIHAERRRSRWSVDPRFLAALLVVAVPALATWLIARNDSAPAAAESSPVEAVMPAREDSLNLDALPDDDPTGEAPEGEVDLPDFSEGELVGAWEGDESSAESAAEVDPSSAPDDDAIEPVDVDDAADATPTVEPEPSQGAPVGDPEPSDTEIEAPEAPGAAVGDSTEADAPAAGSIDPASATDEPRIVIDSWTEACRFGPRCLKVGFALEGFESVPAEFVCEFASGARFAFNMPSPTVDFACATGTVGDSITIEVGGVRSETIVHS